MFYTALALLYRMDRDESRARSIPLHVFTKREPSAKAHRDLIVFQDVLHWPLSGNSESIYRCFRKVFSELIMLTDRYCPNSMKVFISNTILFQTQKKYQFKYDNFSSDIWESQVLIMSFNLNKTQHE